jgi:hypothetical protein
MTTIDVDPKRSRWCGGLCWHDHNGECSLFRVKLQNENDSQGYQRRIRCAECITKIKQKLTRTRNKKMLRVIPKIRTDT